MKDETNVVFAKTRVCACVDIMFNNKTDIEKLSYTQFKNIGRPHILTEKTKTDQYLYIIKPKSTYGYFSMRLVHVFFTCLHKIGKQQQSNLKSRFGVMILPLHNISTKPDTTQH